MLWYLIMDLFLLYAHSHWFWLGSSYIYGDGVLMIDCTVLSGFAVLDLLLRLLLYDLWLLFTLLWTPIISLAEV